ncbi:probable protein phosphatase 2C 1 isoform X1 [Triticum urartu]|uniref:Protein phosphatase n=2 Tax=Triticum urartu TaxID=4572 RepID=A0A8R7TSP6_TRIUA|nr:probable protein phosphatase 2C 1 isoform X1 [Triticum urartu]
MAASTASRLSPPCLHAAPHHPLRRSRFSPLRAAKLEAVLSIGTHVIPHPRKVETGGEDAFFVGGDGCGVFAIADGVSGWAEKNVNPALFSRELMANSSTFIKDEEVSQDPQILLMKAHAATSSIGSATVIVAMLEKTGTLKIASVGDCGLKVIRKGQVMFSTCPQEHYFDCPYQLSSEAIGQTSQDALVCTVNLMEGDMIVSGSDGFFDNIFDQEILSVINESPGTDEAAKALAELARKHSVDVTFDSPYSMEARSRGFDVPWWKKLLGAKLVGGKMDDITVIVAQVKTVVIPDDEGSGVELEKVGGEQLAAAGVASTEQNE